jgi:4-hydroxy-tetrahydrodipicolinate synthase
MKLDTTATGVYSIAPTPFHDDGSIDWNSVDRMTDFYFEMGCNGFTILGVLGEAPKLDAEEALALAARVIKRASGKPIIVGVSAPGFAAMRSLSRKVMDMGAAGVMIAPGAGLKTDDQITAYFRNAMEAIGSDIPWVLQDYPHSTGVTMSNTVVRKVVMENPSLVILKHEDWPGLDKITTLRGWEKDGSMRKISILVGNNGLFLDFELDRGVDGANTGYAFPDMLVEAVKLSKEGKRDEAHDLFDAHLPLLRYDHQPGVGLAVRKYVLQRRGVLSTAAMRKPAPAFSAQTRAEVDYLLARLAKRDPRAKV